MALYVTSKQLAKINRALDDPKVAAKVAERIASGTTANEVLGPFPAARRMPAQRPGTSKQDYATPREFITAVTRRFGHLSWDLAAHEDNVIPGVDGYFGPGGAEEDALKTKWSKLRGNLWLNPEFGVIPKWAAKCAASQAVIIKRQERERRRDDSADPIDWSILLLVPASIGSRWFEEYVWQRANVIGLVGRLSFDGKAPYPKDCMLCRYGTELVEHFELWDWRKDL